MSDSEGRLLLWDLDTSEALWELGGFSGTPGAVAFSPGGDRALVAAAKGALLLLDVAAGEVTAQLEGHSGRVSFIDWSTSERYPVTASGNRGDRLAGPFGIYDDTLRVWDVESRRSLPVVDTSACGGASTAVWAGGARTALLACNDGSVRTLDMVTRENRAIEAGQLAWIRDIAVTGDGRTVVVGRRDGRLDVWDLESVALRGSYRDSDQEILALAIVPGDDLVLAGGGTFERGQTQDARIRIWDLTTGTVAGSYDGHRSRVSALAVSASGELVLSAEDDSWIHLWRLSDRETIRTWRAAGSVDDATVVAFHPDGDRVVASTQFGEFAVWDLDTGEELERVARATLGHGGTRGGALASDGSVMVTVGFGDRAKLRHVDTGALLRTFDAGRFGGTSADLAPGGRQALVGSSDGIMLYDAVTGDLLATFDTPRENDDVVRFVPGGTHIVSGGRDGVLKVRRPETGDTLAMVASGDDWLAYQEDGTFDASLSGSRLVAVSRGFQAFHLGQLAARYNRPDLLLQRLGLGPPGLAEHFRAWHFSRLRSLGLTEDRAFGELSSAPQARIVEVERDGAEVEVCVELTTTSDGPDLSRADFFVNNVRVAEHRIEGRAATVTQRIALIDGANRIEVAAIDAAGVMSLRDHRQLDHRGGAGVLHFVGIGVSRYRNPRLDLTYPRKDVTDLADVLRAGVGFEEVHATVLVDEEATVQAVEEVLAALANTSPDDTVVIMVAGHGMHARDTEARYYLLTHYADPSAPAVAGLDLARLEALLDGIPARRRLLLLDSCESGLHDETTAPSPAVGTLASRSAVLRSHHDVAPSWLSHLQHRDRYVYTDLARHTGASVFSSSRGWESAYENPAVANGLFTEAILRALTSTDADSDGDGWVDLSELERHVASEVADQSGGRQHPGVERPNPLQDVRLPIAKGARYIVDRDLAVPPGLTGGDQNATMIRDNGE